MEEDEINTNELEDCLPSLIKVSSRISLAQLTIWFNENDIDYFNLTDIEMYIIYIRKNLRK